jgi:hypothetical protein
MQGSLLALTIVPNVATAQGGSWDGPYRPLPYHNDVTSGGHAANEIAHAILIAKPGPTQGKVLVITYENRWLWDPASPHSVTQDIFTEEPMPQNQMWSGSMFCSSHTPDSAGNIVIPGGQRFVPFPLPVGACGQPSACGPQPRWSHLLDPAAMAFTQYPMLDVYYHSSGAPSNFGNRGFWYPGSTRLPDGRVMTAGGGSSPVTSLSTNNPCSDCLTNYFNDGWQVFNPAAATPGWIGEIYAGVQHQLQGLPGTDEFNWYPLLVTMPGSGAPGGSGLPFVFAASVTNNRQINLGQSGFTGVQAPTGVLPVDEVTAITSWLWQTYGSSTAIRKSYPSGAARNLEYPNGFLWPLALDASGQLMPGSVRRYVVLGGADLNDAPTDAPGYTGSQTLPSGPIWPNGGRPAVADVYSMDDPRPGAGSSAAPVGSWTNQALPALGLPRCYQNTVLTPDEKAYVFGGSAYDYMPFLGQGVGLAKERTAAPWFIPEVLDLRSPTGWVGCAPHVSPRLYHSVALLLPDARILVAGGHRGVRPSSYPSSPPSLPEHETWYNWRHEHSDFEVYSPDYMFASRRPQIVSVQTTSGVTPAILGYGQQYEVTIAFPGSDSPATDVDSICLISPGSVTHHFDWNQRFVKLWSSPSSASAYKRVVTMPADETLAPPGWYMMFATSIPMEFTAQYQGGTVSTQITERIPSHAKFINLQ